MSANRSRVGTRSVTAEPAGSRPRGGFFHEAGDASPPRFVRRSKPGESLQRGLQGLIAFGKTESHHALVESAAVEGRKGNGGHSGLAREPGAELVLAQVADGRDVDALEVTSFAGQQPQPGARQAITEQVALVLVERRQSQVRF